MVVGYLLYGGGRRSCILGYGVVLVEVLVDRWASLSCHDLARIFPSGGPCVMATGGEGRNKGGRMRAEILNHNLNADTNSFRLNKQKSPI